MASTIVRPVAPVSKVLEFSPYFAAETTEGAGDVAALATAKQVDQVSGGRVWSSPNVQTFRTVGGVKTSQGGILRAGLDNLQFHVRSADFIQHAIRGAGTWAWGASPQSLVMYAGAAGEALLLPGSKIDTLELSQEYNADGAPLQGSATVMALRGEHVSTPPTLPTVTQPLPFMQYMGAALTNTGGIAITVPTPPAGKFHVRSWSLSIRNNLHYVALGDVAAATGRTPKLREAWQLRAGEEEVEFSLTVEVPLRYGDDVYDDFVGDCYQAGGFAATIDYVNSCVTPVNKLRIALSNLQLSEDAGFDYEYDPEGMANDPVHVYTFRFVKAQPFQQSVAISMPV